MMNPMSMDAETMVGMTVLASVVITAVVLTIRTKLTRVPVRQPVQVADRRRAE